MCNRVLVVLQVDYLTHFYDQVNDYWCMEKDTSLKHVTVVSLGGGDRDVLVNYHLTRLDTLVAPSRAISVSVCASVIYVYTYLCFSLAVCHYDLLLPQTSSIPKAWVSTDHQCAVWCKQIVLSLVRALCDLSKPSSSLVMNRSTNMHCPLYLPAHL